MANFQDAFAITLSNEGGYANDKLDKGGETRYGISKRSYPNEDIANLTLERAATLYKRDFWDVLRLDEIKSQDIANELFDTAVNCGVGTAAKILQKSINLTNKPQPDISVDGIIGPATVAAVNNHKSPKALLICLKGFQFDHYVAIVTKNPDQMKWFKGWLFRV